MNKEIIPRYLNLSHFLNKKSCFLFGPRSSGKTVWIKQTLPDALYINLLNSVQRRAFYENPNRLLKVLEAEKKSFVIIDEIQKVPELLDEIHMILVEQENKYTFLLTGSSPRKLKRSGANLLGGRAKRLDFFPFCWVELFKVQQFNLEKFLTVGGLPKVYLGDDPQSELEDYFNIYLNEEIREETAIRNIRGFENFLVCSAHLSGQVINYTKLANDTQLNVQTVKEYVQVLEDTLLLFRLTPFQSNIRKPVKTEKIYLFDIGVRNHLKGIPVIFPKTEIFGEAFEHFIISEVRTYVSYNRKKIEMNFWRDQNGHEVDLVVAPYLAIEIKSTTKIVAKDHKNLKIFMEEKICKQSIIVSLDPVKEKWDDSIEHCPWDSFLQKLWEGHYF